MLLQICEAPNAGGVPAARISHLLPLTMQITLPSGYPAHESPQYQLEAAWLSPAQLYVLQEQLQRLWEEQAGMPVLYTWCAPC